MKCNRCNNEAEPNRTLCGDCSKKNNSKSSERRKCLISEGKCVRCGSPTIDKIQCELCCEKQRKYRSLQKDKELCSQCDNKSLEGHTRCEYHTQLKKKSDDKLKDEVFSAYGGYKCNCCGETIVEFLVIDHIDGGGTEHRKNVVGTGIYRWLRQNGFPEGFQVLCCNCNWGRKFHNGICPHKLNKP